MEKVFNKIMHLTLREAMLKHYQLNNVKSIDLRSWSIQRYQLTWCIRVWLK